MKKSLFLLIKSMLRGEKRSFNLYAQRYNKGKEKASLRLYEILNKKGDVDEKEIVQKFAKSHNKKQLPYVAHELFQTIIESLREHLNKEYEALEVSKLMDYTLILYHRGLFKEAENNIKKAKKIAYSIGYFGVMPQILKLDARIQKRLLSLKDISAFNQKNWAEFEQVLLILQNQVDYSKLSDQIYEIYRRYGVVRNAEDEKRYTEIINHPLLKSIENAHSLQAKNIHYGILCIYYTTINQYPKAQEYILKIMDLYEEKGEYLRFRMESYINMGNNAIFISSQLNDYPALIRNIQKMRDLTKQFPKLESYYVQRIFESTYSTELGYYIREGDVYKGLNLIPTIEAGLNEFPIRGVGIERYLNIATGVAIVYFLDNQLEKAKEWVDKVIAMEDKKTALYIIAYAKILDLILHVEANNFVYLQNYSIQVLNFLKRHKRLFEVEEKFIKLIKKISEQALESDRKILREQYLEDFYSSQKEQQNHFLFSYIKIHCWLQSVAHKTSIKEELLNVRNN